jgi:hypothetical protein
MRSPSYQQAATRPPGESTRKPSERRKVLPAPSILDLVEGFSGWTGQDDRSEGEPSPLDEEF